MYVGPFVYLNHPRIRRQGLYADLLPHDQAVRSGPKLSSPLSHRALLNQIAPGENDLDMPRGHVVYDLESHQAIIYLDRCMEKHLDEIVRLFELPVWVVEYDDHYVCPRCDHLVNRF